MILAARKSGRKKRGGGGALVWSGPVRSGSSSIVCVCRCYFIRGATYRYVDVIDDEFFFCIFVFVFNIIDSKYNIFRRCPWIIDKSERRYY